MSAMIRVDAYHFLAFSDLTCHLEDTGGAFWLPPDSKKTELESNNQEASPSGFSSIFSSDMNISEVSGLLQQMSSQ